MSETAVNARPNTQRRNDVGAKKSKKTVVMLISCCLFLFIVSSCLLAALVLIGKHFVYNSNHTQQTEKSLFAKEKQRAIQLLPKEVSPLHYDLTLMPNLETGEFLGIVNITLIIVSSRNNILLHSKNLNIDTVDLMYVNKSVAVQVQNVEDNQLDEMIKIVPKEKLPVGVYYMILKYRGLMINKIVGLYRSLYKNDANQSR